MSVENNLIKELYLIVDAVSTKIFQMGRVSHSLTERHSAQMLNSAEFVMIQLRATAIIQRFHEGSAEMIDGKRSTTKGTSIRNPKTL